MAATFDPSGVGLLGRIFGFPYTIAEADLVILPIPWDATASYRDGSANAPKAILDASAQLDFNIYGLEEPWNYKIAMLSIDPEVQRRSEKTRELAKRVIGSLERGKLPHDADVAEVNQSTSALCANVVRQVKHYRSQGKHVAALGGDHSTPLGLIDALQQEMDIGILQIDAHMDLRKAYEGFEQSHASIMYNALQLSGVSSLTQVGVRDYCEEETSFIASCDKPIHTFFEDQLRAQLFAGQTWKDLVAEIIDTLPHNVYVSFDIDGLSPELCPSTGTPVPGGLRFEEADYLIRQLSLSGKNLIGFDLSEVAPGPNEWDANVGARVLYRLCCAMGVSDHRIKVK